MHARLQNTDAGTERGSTLCCDLAIHHFANLNLPASPLFRFQGQLDTIYFLAYFPSCCIDIGTMTYRN